MPTAYRQPSSSEPPSLRRRASGFALAIGINLLILLVLLGLGVGHQKPPPQPGALVVNLEPEPDKAAASATKAAAPAHKVPVPKPHAVPPVKPPLIPPTRPLDLLVLSKDELAAADIGKIAKSGSGSSAGDSEEAGRGPNGQVLYAAEWARRPTDAELSGYLPANMPAEGYGLVACRTIPGNRVEDCIELDQSPRGSHLASAVRQAAWQFRVRPPRKNGRPMVGEWVQILIEYSSRGGRSHDG